MWDALWCGRVLVGSRGRGGCGPAASLLVGSRGCGRDELLSSGFAADRSYAGVRQQADACSSQGPADALLVLETCVVLSERAMGSEGGGDRRQVSATSMTKAVPKAQLRCVVVDALVVTAFSEGGRYRKGWCCVAMGR